MRYTLFSIFIIFLSVKLMALDTLDICKGEDKQLCSSIHHNYQMIKSKNKKQSLKSIVFLSRKLVFLSKRDRDEIISGLTSKPTYKSIFSNHDIFMTIAEKCNHKIYLVEAYFDADHYVKFLEKKFTSIKAYNDFYLIDHIKYYLSDSNRAIYNNVFNKFTPHNRKEQPSPQNFKIINVENEQCIAVKKGVILRDPNKLNKIIFLKKNERVSILKSNALSRKTKKGKIIFYHLIEYYKNKKKYVGYVCSVCLNNCD